MFERRERLRDEQEMEQPGLEAAHEYPRGPRAAPKPKSTLRVCLIETCIFLVWLAFMLINFVLRLLGVLRCIVMSYRDVVPLGERPKEVVIVGASFGGLAAQRELSGRRDVRVRLIDFKNYFEYTPGALRCFVDPSYLAELTCPLPRTRNEVGRASNTSPPRMHSHTLTHSHTHHASSSLEPTPLTTGAQLTRTPPPLPPTPARS